MISTGYSLPGLPSDSDALRINHLQKRDLPSIGKIKDQIKDRKDGYLFYSGPGAYGKKAREWSKRNGGYYKILSQLWKDSSWPDQYRENGPMSTQFDHLSSRAMAEKAEGKVHVLLPSVNSSLEWSDETIWAKYEWPKLPTDVTVIRVNPDNTDEEVIWGEKGEWEFSFYQNGRCSGPRNDYSGKGEKECQTGLLNGLVDAYIPMRMAANCKAIFYSDDDCDDEVAEHKPMAKKECTEFKEGVQSWKVKCDW